MAKVKVGSQEEVMFWIFQLLVLMIGGYVSDSSCTAALLIPSIRLSQLDAVGASDYRISLDNAPNVSPSPITP